MRPRRSKSPVATTAFDRNVFINCPFDRQYQPIFRAIVFAVLECGFEPRCALEASDRANRLDRIQSIVGECKYGIHDVSRTTLDSANRLPRFNMPFELGLFVGASAYGDTRQRAKQYLVLDRERYRVQKFLSDLNGIDPKAHDNDPLTAIKCVRDWLVQFAGRSDEFLPGIGRIAGRYRAMTRLLPKYCRAVDLPQADLQFVEYRRIAALHIETMDDALNAPRD